MDDVFRALADESRRALLDALFARNGQTLAELTAGLPMSRQAVTKHLAILEGANLISVVRRGLEEQAIAAGTVKRRPRRVVVNTDKAT